MRANSEKSESLSPLGVEPWSGRQVYREMADQPVVELDTLAQLEANVVLLENLHLRLAFMMREVGGLLSRS